MTIHIEPFDDATKKRLLKAVAARGQASGLAAAAKLIAMMADHKRRVVGTNEIKASYGKVDMAGRVGALSIGQHVLRVGVPADPRHDQRVGEGQ